MASNIFDRFNAANSDVWNGYRLGQFLGVDSDTANQLMSAERGLHAVEVAPGSGRYICLSYDAEQWAKDRIEGTKA